MESNHGPKHYQVCAGKTADLPKRTKPHVRRHISLTKADP